LLAVVAFAACDRQSAAQPDASDATVEAASGPSAAAGPLACADVTPDGYCGVRFGMTAEEAMNAFPGGLFKVEGAGTADEAACYYLFTAKDRYDLGLMVVDGRIERIDARSTAVAAPAGAKVGMAFDEVERLYANPRREPNHYMAPIEDLIVDLGGGVFAVFEQDEAGRVSAFRVGREPAVSFIEGCS
jgi:hypothetical protein